MAFHLKPKEEKFFRCWTNMRHSAMRRLKF